MAKKAKTVAKKKPAVERRGKKIADPKVVPVAPKAPEPSPAPVEPEASPEPVIVQADAVGMPEGADVEKPDHYIPKPTFILMDDGQRYRERKFDHSRTVTIDGVQYEHVAEDAQGHWIYARS